MSEHVMGIEIGNSNIKIVEVSRKAAMMIVHKFSLIKTPEGMISNGVITDPTMLKKIIAEELAAKKYRAKKVVSVVQSSTILIRNAVMDKQPDKIIKEILDMKLEEYLPIKKNEYQVDYKIVREFQEEEKEKYELELVAAPDSIILPLAALLKSLKLTPTLITIHSEAISHVFGGQRRLLYDAAENLLILDIGGYATSVTIVAGGQSVLNRYIEFGVEHIQQAMEEVKNRSSLLEKQPDEEELFERVKPQIERNIISEVERILQFYNSNFNSGLVKKTYLAGGGAELKGMRRYIKDALNIPTDKLTEYSTVTEEEGVDFAPYRRFFINILGAINGL